MANHQLPEASPPGPWANIMAGSSQIHPFVYASETDPSLVQPAPSLPYRNTYTRPTHLGLDSSTSFRPLAPATGAVFPPVYPRLDVRSGILYVGPDGIVRQQAVPATLYPTMSEQALAPVPVPSGSITAATHVDDSDIQSVPRHGIYQERPNDPFVRISREWGQGVWDTRARHSFWVPAGFTYEGKTTDMKPNYHVFGAVGGPLWPINETLANREQQRIRRHGQKAKDRLQRIANPQRPTQRQIEKMIRTWEKVWEMKFLGLHAHHSFPSWGPSYVFDSKDGLQVKISAPQLARLIQEDWPKNVDKWGHMGLGTIISDSEHETTWFCGPMKRRYPRTRLGKSGDRRSDCHQVDNGFDTSEDTRVSDSNSEQFAAEAEVETSSHTERKMEELGRKKRAHHLNRQQATHPFSDDEDDGDFDDDFRTE